MKVKLKDGPIRPLQVKTPRKTPYAFKKAPKSKLDYLVDLGVFKLVKNMSDWSSLMCQNLSEM